MSCNTMMTRNSNRAAWMLLIALFSLSSIAEGKNKVTLNPKIDIQHQLQTENTTYVVKKAVDLHGKMVAVPYGSELLFKCKGQIRNGSIVGINTEFKGKVKLSCNLSGTFVNEEIPVSWLNIADREVLSQQIASIFNLEKSCTVMLDRDITMDGTQKNVRYVAFSGKKRVSNSCSYNVSGDVTLQGVNFSDFETYRELFIDLRGITRAVTVDISYVKFDGSWNISRFIYCPYQKFAQACRVDVRNSEFTRVRNYVLQFRPACTGSISGNRIEDVGTDEFSNVIGFHLGDSDDEADRMCANGFEIAGNEFRNFKVPYNDKDDGREAHALLIYGHKNVVCGNKVVDFYSTQKANGDPGRDSEGIYLKGGENTVEDNYLDNCVGSGPDGAITLKMTYGNNRIAGNTVRHKFGVGIQCYTPNSRIENNKIYSEGDAVEGIAMLANRNSEIINNELYSAADGKQYHAAIALNKCDGIRISGNRFDNTSGLLTTYGCTGRISFENNTIELEDKLYGSNTYYTAPINLHDDSADFDLSRNVFTARGLRTSQIIEAPKQFKGKVTLDDNTFDITDSEQVRSTVTYMVRNVNKLTTKQSRNAKIGKVSNLIQ